MREVTITLAGKELTLGATFAASKKIAEQICDPIFLFREVALEAQMAESGFNYQPKKDLGVVEIPKVLHIGLEAAGNSMKLSEVEEMVFEEGFINAKVCAIEYLSWIVTPAPEKGPESGEDESLEK